MHAKTIKPARPPVFEPFKLELTVETLEEAQALYAVFNLSENRHLIGGENVEEILSELGLRFYINLHDQVIANNIKYHEFYRPKLS